MFMRILRNLAPAAAALVTLAGAGLGANTTGPGPLVDEYRVKAAILYHLAKFVDWPADAFASPATPMAVCVLGADPFGAVLDESIGGRQVAGRPVLVRRIAEPEGGCHVLFISTSERRRLALIVERLGTAGVLTVSEEDGFTRLGGIVELITEGERVRFHINTAAAERARLRVSARLLALAANQKAPGGPR